MYENDWTCTNVQIEEYFKNNGLTTAQRGTKTSQTSFLSSAVVLWLQHRSGGKIQAVLTPACEVPCLAMPWPCACSSSSDYKVQVCEVGPGHATHISYHVYIYIYEHDILDYISTFSYLLQSTYQKKFRSQTSDNMDRWKGRGGKSQWGEEKKWEDQRRGREGRKRMQVREKVGKSRFHSVFPMICGSGRRVEK